MRASEAARASAAAAIRYWRPASVITIWRCVSSSVKGGSMARKTSPTGAR